VDLSPQMLARARGRGIDTTLTEPDVCQSLEQLPRSYDLILSADLFVCIGDLDELFALERQCLHGGGLFACSIEVVRGQS